jgi:hypothetical protein
MTTVAIPAVPEYLKTRSEKNVRDQSDEWHPDQWMRALAGIHDLTALVAQLRSAWGDRIRRDDLLELANQVRSDSDRAMELFIGTMAWGYAEAGYGPGRIRRLIEGLGDPAAAVKAAFDSVERLDPVEGYKSLMVEHHLHGLGPSFATKFLYFATYEKGAAGSLRALILDRRVERALREHHCLFVTASGPDPVGYEIYLRMAEAWRKDLGWQESDAVEFELFEGGGRLFRQESSERRRQRWELPSALAAAAASPRTV